MDRSTTSLDTYAILYRSHNLQGNLLYSYFDQEKIYNAEEIKEVFFLLAPAN